MGRTHIGLGRLAAVAEGGGERGLHQGFGEGALGAVGGRSDDAGREAAIRTAGTPAVVGGDEGQDAGGLAGRGARFSHRGVVADDAHFEVALHLDGLEGLLASQFRGTASLIDHFLGAGDAAGLRHDLHIVADAGGQVGGAQGVVVAFELRVGGHGGGEGFGLPLVIDVGRLRGPDVGHEGGFFGSDAIDHVLQVFADANVRGGRSDGIGGSSHGGLASGKKQRHGVVYRAGLREAVSGL